MPEAPAAPAPQTAPAAAPAAPTPAPAAPAAPAPANVTPQTAAAPSARALGDPAAAPAAPAAPAAEAKPGEKPAEAPKAAEWKLEAPKDSPLAAESVTKLEAWAKEQGLSQAQAEKLLARDAQSVADAKVARDAEAKQAGEQWLKQAQAHPEMKNWDAAIDNANRALNQFATEDERKAILASPFRNNPVFLAILNRAGAVLTREQAPVETAPRGGGQSAKTPAERIYGFR